MMDQKICVEQSIIHTSECVIDEVTDRAQQNITLEVACSFIHVALVEENIYNGKNEDEQTMDDANDSVFGVEHLGGVLFIDHEIDQDVHSSPENCEEYHDF